MIIKINKLETETKLSSEKVSGPLTPQIVFTDKNFMIEALDGSQYISNAKEIFKSYIDGNFKRYGFNKRGKVTRETLVDIYQMVGIKTFNQVFKDISEELDKLVMTQHQIIRFCEKYPGLILRPDGITLFLIKNKKEYFIARVGILSDGLNIIIDPFVTNNVWAWKGAFRIIVPRAKSLGK